MALKEKITTGLLILGGLLSGKKLQAQDIFKSADETRILPTAWKGNPEVSSPSDTLTAILPIQNTTSVQQGEKVPWKDTAEGRQAIEAYAKAMKKIGENPTVSSEDILYLRALSDFNHEVAMLDGTGYVMDKEDLLGVIPDSLQNKFAEDASKSLTPSAYKGSNCNHAVKRNFFSNGFMLQTSGVVSASSMESHLMEDINFVGLEIEPHNDCYVANGTTKVYRKTKAHPHGHISFAVKNENAEVSQDSSDKLRQNINENNYSGVVCFFTAHSEVSLETCLAAWGTKYKNDHWPIVINSDADIKGFHIDLTAKQIFETAVACKSQYFEKYNKALNNMRVGYRDESGYIVGPAVNISLLAHNAQRVASQKAPVRKIAQVRHTGGSVRR